MIRPAVLICPALNSEYRTLYSTRRPVIKSRQMSIQSAINCLDENINLFGDPRVDPEKYNLYNGLSEMARAIQRLDNEVEVIKNTVNGILHEVRRV
jgi:hypothetical protein